MQLIASIKGGSHYARILTESLPGVLKGANFVGVERDWISLGVLVIGSAGDGEGAKQR